MQTGFRARGGLWVIGQSVFMIVIGVLSLWVQARERQPALVVLGIGLIVVGGFLGLAGAWVLRGSLTPFPQPLPQASLVRRGIYAQVRHPLYTSVVTALMGWSLVCHSWPAALGTVLLAGFFVAKARHEEQQLRERFPEYEDYARQTRRFIPWIY